MGYGYSMDLRERVVAAYEAGGSSYEEIAERFQVGRATVDRWLHLARKTGSVAHRALGGGRRSIFHGENLQSLERLVIANADATAQELVELWHAAGGARTSRSAVTRALGRLGYTLKKSPLPSTKPTPSASPR
jgi:transposase